MHNEAFTEVEVALRAAERAEAEAMALRVLCAALAAHVVDAQGGTGKAMADLGLSLNVAIMDVVRNCRDQPVLADALARAPQEVLELARTLLGSRYRDEAISRFS